MEESRAPARLAFHPAPAASTPLPAIPAALAIPTRLPTTAATSTAPTSLSALSATLQEYSAAKPASLVIMWSAISAPLVAGTASSCLFKTAMTETTSPVTVVPLVACWNPPSCAQMRPMPQPLSHTPPVALAWRTARTAPEISMTASSAQPTTYT